MANASIQTIETPKKYRALDTSGNNNHGQIYSGRGLEFDGVVDYLDTGTTFSETNHTIALWVYMDNSASSTNIVDIRDANDDGILIQQESNETIVYHVDDDILTTTTAHLNTWIRVVCTYDGTTQKLYVNGILDASATVSETISTTVNMLIGSRSFTSRTSYFSGKMSNFQAWDTAWSADDVTYDYLNPESLALNASGTSLTESNLKVWYPMQDGHRGQQSYILDGANTGLGSELINDGGFDTDTAEDTAGTYWETQASWIITGGKASYDADANGVEVFQQPVTTVAAGKVIKLQFDLLDIESGKVAYFKIQSNGNSEQIIGYTQFQPGSEGTYTYYHTNVIALDRLLFIALNSSG